MTVTEYVPGAELSFEFPWSFTKPEPHPETATRALDIRSKKTMGRHRLLRGTHIRNSPLIATPVVNGNQGNRFGVFTSPACAVVVAIAIVSEVCKAAGPVGVTLTGAKLHVVPAGIPPVQAKVIVE